jgi:CoA:oxalate CoA-transferase
MSTALEQGGAAVGDLEQGAVAPLRGIRVVDFSEMVPGPFLTGLMADLGAEVHKVERPTRDATYLLQRGTYEALNAAKQVHLLDLKDRADVQRATDLVRTADIVVEGFRPGVMNRLGFGFAELSECMPGLIYVSMTGFGQSGPFANTPGHDINYLAVSGLLAVSGDIRSGPANAVGLPIADLASSMYALSATLAALIQRGATGAGQHLDVSITDCLTHWMNLVIGQFAGQDTPSLEQIRTALLRKPAYGVFPTSDDQWVAIAASEEKFWNQLVAALDLDVTGIACATRADRLESCAGINERIAVATAMRTSSDLVALLTQADVPATELVSPLELGDSVHATARKLMVASDVGPLVRFPVRVIGMRG